MNTKATAAATNAPTAKDDNKAANAGTTKAANNAQFVPLTAKEQADYEELKERFHELDDDEEARLIELKKKSKAAEKSKHAYIGQLKNEISQAGLSIKDIFKANEVVSAYDFKELFTAEELKKVVIDAGYEIKDVFPQEKIKALIKKGKSQGADTSNTGASAGEVATATKKPKYKSKEAGVAMFEFPKGSSGAAPSPYYKGRAFEDAKKTDEHGYAVTYKHEQVNADGTKPWSIYPSGQTVPSGVYTYLDEKNYEHYISAQNKESIQKYLATPEGKTELALILEEAKRGRTTNKKELVPFKKA